MSGEVWIRLPGMEPEKPTAPYRNLRELLSLVMERIGLRHLSPRTGTAYVRWIRRFVLFSGNRDPTELGKRQIEAFLSHLAIKGQVGASTQNQALAGILFLYREILGKDVPWLDGLVRAKRPKRLPVVMNRREVQEVLGAMRGPAQLLASILYGSGLRKL